MRERVRNFLEQRGIARDRVELMDKLPTPAEHLAAYGNVDIALDTFPYNGASTACESLWMGVPVVTFAGDRHAARVGASMLSRVGLEGLVADRPQDYIETAARLAADLVGLARLRADLRSRVAASPLCDGPLHEATSAPCGANGAQPVALPNAPELCRGRVRPPSAGLPVPRTYFVGVFRRRWEISTSPPPRAQRSVTFGPDQFAASTASVTLSSRLSRMMSTLIIDSGLVDPQQCFTRGTFGENRVMGFKFDLEKFEFVVSICSSAPSAYKTANPPCRSANMRCRTAW
jgi:hypothetical protein